MELPRIHVTASGTTQYSINGLLHRENGPAVEYADGKVAWWIYGRNCSLQTYIKDMKLSPTETTMLLLTYS